MIDYLCYVKKQYSKEKDYEKFLVGLTIFMLIGYLITGDNLNLLFIFGGLSIMYIFGILYNGKRIYFYVIFLAQSVKFN